MIGCARAMQLHELSFLSLRGEIPAVLLAEEAAENPRIMSLLASILDANGDGMISASEVVRAQELADGTRGLY